MLNAILKYFIDEAHLKRGVCPLHKCDLQEGEVPIVYGRRSRPDKYHSVRKQSFPQSNSDLTGGCLVYEGQPKTGKVRYCPVCRTAEEVWWSQYHTGSRG